MRVSGPVDIDHFDDELVQPSFNPDQSDIDFAIRKQREKGFELITFTNLTRDQVMTILLEERISMHLPGGDVILVDKKEFADYDGSDIQLVDSQV